MSLLAHYTLVERSKKRMGRGHGSGKVKTGGRGTKGQNARDHMKLDFEGGQLALTKRLPLKRGKLRNKPVSPKPFPLDISKLAGLKAGTVVTLELLKKEGIVNADVSHVKILGKTAPTVHLTLNVPASQSVVVALEKLGKK
jgi:large subunit ribosomal protein L15